MQRLRFVPLCRVNTQTHTHIDNIWARCMNSCFQMYVLFCMFLLYCCLCGIINDNKSAQSNLGRGPRRGAVAHVRRKVPIGYNGARPKSAPKIPLPVDRSPNPTTCLIPGPVRPMLPNGVRIQSEVFPQCTGQTDRPTDKSFTETFDDYRPLRYESDAA